jgi:hypothetical protein
MYRWSSAQHYVERRAPEWTEQRRTGNAFPEPLEPRLGVLSSSLRITINENRGVHRACRGARYAFDAKPRLLEEAVEHAPGEGAMRPAPLQGKVDQDLAVIRIGGHCSGPPCSIRLSTAQNVRQCRSCS